MSVEDEEGRGLHTHESIKARHQADTTHHPGLHSPDSLVLGIMRDIGRTVEKVVDSMASIRSHDGTGVCTGDGFARITKDNKTTKAEQRAT